MYKFICLLLCVVAASGVHATKANTPTLRENLKLVIEECAKEFPGVTDHDINKAATEGDSTKINPCFNGCVFKKAGLINDKGEYDLITGLTNLRKIVKDDKEYTKLEEVARDCTSVNDTVTDGKAGCERGARLSTCFLQYKDKVLI